MHFFGNFVENKNGEEGEHEGKTCFPGFPLLSPSLSIGASEPRASAPDLASGPVPVLSSSFSLLQKQTKPSHHDPKGCLSIKRQRRPTVNVKSWLMFHFIGFEVVFFSLICMFSF